MGNTAKTGLQKLKDSVDSSVSKLEQLEKKQIELSSKTTAAKQSLDEQSKVLSDAKSKYDESAVSLGKFKDRLEESRQSLVSQKQILADSKVEAANLKANYEHLKKALGDNAAETIKAKEAYEQSHQVVKENKQAVQYLEVEYKALNEEFKQNALTVKQAKSEHEKIEKEYNKQQNTLNALEKELEQTNGAIEEQNDHLLIATSSWVEYKTKMSDVSKEAKTVSETLSSVGKGLIEIGTKMSVGITAPLTLLGKGIISVGMDFEASLSGIKAVTGATTEEMKLFKDAAMEAGEKTKYSASESANAIEELAKAGVSTADILNGGLNGALILAAAGEIEVADAAEIASTVLNAFRKDALSVGDAANILAGAANASATDVGELKYGLSAVSSVASGMGMNFRDTATALAVFAQNSLKGSDAGTSLKTMLMNLQPRTDEQIAQFKELGLLTEEGTSRFYDMNGSMRSLEEIAGLLQSSMAHLTEAERSMALEVMFGSDAIRGANVLYAEGAEGVSLMWEAMSKVEAADVAAERMNNLKGRVEELSGRFETLQIRLFDTEKGALSAIVEKLTEVVDWFLNLDDSALQAIVTIGLVAAAIGPVLIITGTLISTMGSIAGAISTFTQAVSIMGMTAGMAVTPTTLLAGALTALKGAVSLLTGPVGWVIGALGVAAVAIKLVIDEQKKAREELLNSGAALKELGDELDNVSAKSKSLVSLIDRHEELTAAIQSNTLSEQEAIAAKQKLSDVEDELIASSDGLLTSYDKENRLVRERLPLLREVAEAEAELARIKLQNKVNDTDIQGLEKEVAKLEEKKNALFETARAQQEAVAKLTALEAEYQDILNDSYKSEEERTQAVEDFIIAANEAAEAVGWNINNLADFEGATEHAKKALKETADELEIVTQEWQAGKIGQAEYIEALKALGIEVPGLTDALNETTDAINEQTDAINEQTDSTDDASKASDELTESLERQEAEAKAMEEAALDLANEYESLTSKVQNAFKALDNTTELTFEEMEKNQAQNKKVMEQWGENLAHIAKVAGEDFATYLREMGIDSAAEINVLAQASDEKLKEFARNWRDVPGEALDEYSKGVSIAELQAAGADLVEIIASGVSGSENIKIAATSQVTGAKSAMLQKVKDENFENVGNDMGSGIVVGLNESSTVVGAAARRIIEKALAEMRAVAMIKSPSKETEKIAEYMGDGLIIGTENKTEEVARSGENLAKEYISRIEKGFDAGLTDATAVMLGQWTELNQGMAEVIEKSGIGIVQAEIDTLDKLISETEKKNAERNKAAELANKERAIVEAKTHAERIKAIEERDKLIAANELEAQKEQLAKLQEQKNNIVEAYTEMNDAIVAALKEKYAKEKEMSVNNLEDEVSSRREASKAIIEAFETEYEEHMTFLETGKKQLEDIAKQEVQTRKDASKAIIEQYEEEYQAKLKTFDFEESSEISAIQAQIDAIDAQTEAEDRALKQQENQRKIHDLEQKVAQAETAEERIEAQNKLNEEIAKQSREALLQQRKDEKESLKQQIAQVKDTYKQLREAEKENIEEKRKAYQQEMDDHEALLARRLSAVKEQYEIDRQTAQDDIKERRNEYKQREEDIDKFLKEERGTIDEHYEALTKNERMKAEARAIMIEGDQDKIISLLRGYIPDWGTAGRDAGQEFLQELQGVTPSIESEVNRIMGLINQASQAQSQLSGTTSYSHQSNISTQAHQTPQPTPVTYTVQQGDNLWSIGAKYGVSADKLREANGLSRENDERLPIGTVLKIPILHEGGISTKEQLALIDSQEAVLPLAQLSRMLEQIAVSTANKAVSGIVSSVKNFSNSITNNNDHGIKVDLNIDYRGNGSRQDADMFGRFAVNSIDRALRDKGVAIVRAR